MSADSKRLLRALKNIREDFARTAKRQKADYERQCGGGFFLFRFFRRKVSTHNEAYRFVSYQDEENQKSKLDAEMVRWTRAVARYTKALVIVGVLGTAVATGTLWAIKGQLEEMKSAGKQTDAMIEASKKQADAASTQAEIAHDNQERQLRAYLLVNIGDTEESPSGAVSAELSVQQVGVTPAYDLWLAAKIKIANGTAELDKNIWEATADQPPIEWPNLFGSEPKRATIKASFSAENIGLMKQRGQKFYLYGAVCHITTFYGDNGFPGRHEYPFCFSFSPGEKAVPCDNGSHPYHQPRCPRDGWPPDKSADQ